MKHTNIIAFVGIVIIGWLIITQPFGERKQSEFGSILSSWGDRQEEASEVITEKAVSGAEGEYVGNHKEHGRNWSIPNIIRKFFGIEMEDVEQSDDSR